MAHGLRAAAAQAAQREATQHFMVSAASVFDTVRDAERLEISRLEALLTPPAGLWAAGDPTRLLARAPGHESSLSVLASVQDKFQSLQKVAGAVRGPAGHGYERFPDGAPRDAAVYRDWQKMLGEVGTMATTDKTLRLWRTVVDGWAPGVWRPEDVETTAEDRTLRAKLQRFGAAVGIQGGHPA